MHTLNTILVKPYELPPDHDGAVAYARSEAESSTSDFENRAYDWRETNTAGRWESEFPENVILGREHPDQLKCLLEDALEQQQQKMRELVNRLAEKADGCDFKEGLLKIVEGSWPEQADLLHLAELADGEYTADSMFYNADGYTAKITQAVIDEVMKCPEEYAVALFDFHW